MDPVFGASARESANPSPRWGVPGCAPDGAVGSTGSLLVGFRVGFRLPLSVGLMRSVWDGSARPHSGTWTAGAVSDLSPAIRLGGQAGDARGPGAPAGLGAFFVVVFGFFGLTDPTEPWTAAGCVLTTARGERSMKQLLGN